MNQVFYDDIQVGNKIPSLVKHPTKEQIVRWAGAVDDYYPIHYDKDFAQSVGLPDIIVHGQLIEAFLSQLITDWIGEQGTIIRLVATHRGMTYPDEDIICKGEITKKYIKNQNHYVECNVFAENQRGEKPATGIVTIILPSKAV